MRGVPGACGALHRVPARRLRALLRQAGFGEATALFRARLVGAWIAEREASARL